MSGRGEMGPVEIGQVYCQFNDETTAIVVFAPDKY